MRRWRRVALVVAGVGLVGIAAVIALGMVASRHSDRLLAGLGKGLGREVRARSIGFGILHGVGVTVDGAEIADDPAFATGAPFLAADALAMRIRVLPLLRGRLVVDEIAVDAPVVNLVRDRSGRLNVDTLGKPGGEQAPTPAPAEEPAQKRRPAFQLASLRLRHGTIRYREAATGRTLELADVAVDARQPQWEAPVPVSVRTRLDTGDLRLDDIVSDGVVDLAQERPAYRGSLKAGPGRAGQIALDRLTAEVRAQPPALDLDAASVVTLGGTVTGTAHVTDTAFTGKLQARELDLTALPAEAGRPRPAGRLALDGTLAGPAPGSPGFKTGATGQGTFAVADGRIEGAGFGRPVLDALQPFLKAGVADRLRERYPDLFASDDLRFTRLAGSGRLAGGRIRSDDLALAATSWEAHGEGTLALDGALEATVRLALSPALTDDLLGQEPRARAALVDSSGRLAIPLRVHGPVRKPRVTPDPAFAGTVARALIGGGLGDVAGDVLERLLGPRRRRER